MRENYCYFQRGIEIKITQQNDEENKTNFYFHDEYCFDVFNDEKNIASREERSLDEVGSGDFIETNETLETSTIEFIEDFEAKQNDETTEELIETSTIVEDTSIENPSYPIEWKIDVCKNEILEIATFYQYDFKDLYLIRKTLLLID